jgi:hypothetical protein
LLALPTKPDRRQRNVIDADAAIGQVERRRHVVEHPRARHRIGMRHRLEGHRAGVDPDAEDALLLAHRRILARPFEHHDDVVLADRQKQAVGIGQRPEDRQVGAVEIGGDGDFAGRGADLQPFGTVCGAWPGSSVCARPQPGSSIRAAR